MKIKIDKLSIMAFILIVFIILVSSPDFSFTPAGLNKSKELAISSWLKLGPFPALLPAFHQDKRK